MKAAEGEAPRRKYLARLLWPLVLMPALVILCPVNIVERKPKSLRTKARAEIAILSAAVTMFKIDTGGYPKTLPTLTAQRSDLEGWGGPYLEESAIPLDPWGREYHYHADSLGYTIACYGADGVEGGTGEDADIIHPRQGAGR